MASVDPTGRSAVAVAAVQPTALAAAWAQRGGGFSGLKRTADLWFSTPASDCPCLRLCGCVNAGGGANALFQSNL